MPVSQERTPGGTPEEGLQLVLGVKVTGPGVARYRAVEVTYRVAKRQYREGYENALYLYLCAPEEDYPDPNTCPGTLEGEFDDVTAG